MGASQAIVSGKFKHEQVADQVREQIRSGVLARGSRLLPDEDLAQLYNVNRNTVAAGLNILVKEGLLERAPRRGTVVAETLGGKDVSAAVGMVMLGEGDVYGDLVRQLTTGLFRHGLYPVLIDWRMLEEHGNVLPFLNSLISERTRPYGFLVDGGVPFPFDYFKGKIDEVRIENVALSADRIKLSYMNQRLPDMLVQFRK